MLSKCYRKFQENVKKILSLLKIRGGSGGSNLNQLEISDAGFLNERSQGYEPCGINQASPPRLGFFYEHHS